MGKMIICLFLVGTVDTQAAECVRCSLFLTTLSPASFCVRKPMWKKLTLIKSFLIHFKKDVIISYDSEQYYFGDLDEEILF